jgi:hypothetical protein
MSLYYVNHQHTAESCPARDPEKGNMLLRHLSPQNAMNFGVKILSDAVLDNLHTFILILEAEDEKNIRTFMQPFEMAGTVNVQPASHCETVVEREGC